MIAEYIKSLLPSEWPITIGDLPSPNVEAIGIVEFDGSYSVEHFGPQSGCSIMKPLVKLVFRGQSYETLASQVETAKQTLHRYHDDTLLSVMLVGSPMYLGRSEQKYHEFQETFQIQVKE